MFIAFILVLQSYEVTIVTFSIAFRLDRRLQVAVEPLKTVTKPSGWLVDDNMTYIIRRSSRQRSFPNSRL